MGRRRRKKRFPTDLFPEKEKNKQQTKERK